MNKFDIKKVSPEQLDLLIETMFLDVVKAYELVDPEIIRNHDFKRVVMQFLKVSIKLYELNDDAHFWHVATDAKINEYKKAGMQENVICQKGCSHCCHMPVTVTDKEADLLAEKIKLGSINIDDRKIKIQSSYNFDNYMELPHKDRGCVFLKNGCCSVYEIRPLVCRTHFSLEPSAELCDISVTSRDGIRYWQPLDIFCVKVVVQTFGGVGLLSSRIIERL